MDVYGIQGYPVILEIGGARRSQGINEYVRMVHYSYRPSNRPTVQLAQETLTLLLFNIAMENGPFIDDVPIKTSIYKGFSMAMLNNQMVTFDQWV